MGYGNMISLFKYKIFGMDFWDYGTCNGKPARRHIFKHNVQFVLWKAGQQGHKTDFWIDFDSSWWTEFKLNPKYVIGSNGIINGDYKEDPHPEAFCQNCTKANVSWYADNELWNKVMPDDGGILCPKCFSNKAEQKGLNIIFHCSEIITNGSESKVLKEA